MIRNTFGRDEDTSCRPDSVSIISGKTSNFSRPYQPSAAPPAMPQSTSLPVLNKQVPHHLLQQSPSDIRAGVTNKHGDPRRVRRRKDPTPFNIMVIGAKNSGKTSLIEFLHTSFPQVSDKPHTPQATPRMTDRGFTSHYVETELEGERVGITLWDSQGLERNIVDLQLKEMTSFVESKFEETFAEEQKVQRTPGSRDTHIHCVFLVLDPLRLNMSLCNNGSKDQFDGNAFAPSPTPAGLDQELDLQVIKAFGGKTTVIPVISKADTLTAAHMRYLKKNVWNTIQSEKLDPLDALDLEESDDEFEPDSEDQEAEDSDTLPIQSHMNGSSAIDSSDENEESSFSTNSHTANSSSPRAMAVSSATTSPGHAFRRPHSRATSRTMALEEPSVEEMYIPFTILTPDPFDPDVIGRRFPWGLADPYNADHCDFTRLRDSVFSEWRTELRNAARQKWYENWRTSRLKRTPQKIRQVGGVTPVRAIPKEGRTFSNERGNFSSPNMYSTSAGLGVHGEDKARPVTANKAERIMGMSSPSRGF